jgi:probable HAF family extracellular repeat protein
MPIPSLSRKLRAKLLPLLSVLACAPALADPLYSINFLPTGFAPSAINNAGQIVGSWNNTAAILSGSSINIVPGVGPDSWGAGINDRGDVAGGIGPFPSAFMVAGGTLTVIPPLMGGGYEAADAAAINNAGAVTGNVSRLNGDGMLGFVYSGGTVRMIGTFGGEWNTAEAINASGAVVGLAALPSDYPRLSHTHAFIDRGGVMQDLGALGGVDSEAYDINDAGLVVGGAETAIGLDGSSPYHPFLYRDGAMLDLGVLAAGGSGEARALNNLGVVVGHSDVPFGRDPRAFLYQDGQMLDLNALATGAGDWKITDAYDINDAGQILGRACRQGECVDVRLDLVSAVPEPSNWMLLLGGLALVSLRRATHRK